MTGGVSVLKNLNKGIELILKIVAAVLLFGLFLIIFMQVILRYFFSTGFKWIDGVSVMGFVWLAMVGSALGVRGNSLARVTIFESKFQNREGMFFWVQKISTLAFMGVLCYASIYFTKQAGRAIYQLLKIPYTVQYVACTVFCICSILFLLEDIVDRIKQRKEE